MNVLRKKRYCVLSNFTIDLLARKLEDKESEVIKTPFGQVFQSLTNPPVSDDYPLDHLIVWCHPHAVLPTFNAFLEEGVYRQEKIFSEIKEFSNLVKQSSSWAKKCTIVSWDLPGHFKKPYYCLGAQNNFLQVLLEINHCMVQELKGETWINYLDIHFLLQQGINQTYTPKLWYLGKLPYSQEVFFSVADAINERQGDKLKKCIALDLDNTIWGGVVGDDGWKNLTLGAPDPNGEAFVDFQKQLKYLKEQGILLVILSKNDEEVALEAFENHPDMVLTKEDFVAWRINWENKPENLISISQELNLGLDSFVFIDDNPVERDLMKVTCPEVFVPDWSQDPTYYVSSLMNLHCFEQPQSTVEDFSRSQMYHHEKERKKFLTDKKSFDEWLKGLELVITYNLSYEVDFSRIVQLINKTNQFNLKTRRFNESEYRRWLEDEKHHIVTFRVKDRFGDYGLVALITFEMTDKVAYVCDFVMSCRVFGRKIEHALVHQVIQLVKKLKASRLEFEFIPTQRNDPCRQFLSHELMYDGQNKYFWDLQNNFPCPEVVNVKQQV